MQVWQVIQVAETGRAGIFFEIAQTLSDPDFHQHDYMNTTGISPWASALIQEAAEQQPPALFEKSAGPYLIRGICREDGLVISVNCPGGCEVLLRAAYAPGGNIELKKAGKSLDGFRVILGTAIGEFTTTIRFPDSDGPLLHVTTTLIPAHALNIPFWPRDLLVKAAKEKNEAEACAGQVHISQVGTRTAMQLITLDRPASGSILYLQNLSALNPYFIQTETSGKEVVGGVWPELGFALPAAPGKALEAHKSWILTDAYLAFSPLNPGDEGTLARLFLDLLAQVYLQLPRPETTYYDWPRTLEASVADLTTNHGCWSHAHGNDYLNAYVCDYTTPPEIMVQLAVLLPLMDYKRWSGQHIPVIGTIEAGLAAFYDEQIGSVVRFLPALASQLSGAEEQLKPHVMDSWYLHHPLLNLSRLALNGDAQARKLFLDSLPFTMKVAHHFNYEWPVFYNMETLEVIKAETAPGKGGQHDVAGLYAHVMLQAWKLTDSERYLKEAEKAALSLRGKGFTLFYQANNTAFSANAMLQLYLQTKKEQYLDLCYLCLANIFQNLHLWECRYGYASHYTTFFGIFPLSDAPYTAAYEEQEVFSAMHNLLVQAEQIELIPSVTLLVAELIRYVIQRMRYYYPANLPEDMLAPKVKTGEIDRKLWIALEDLHDGAEQSGEVGQEVYGAGVAFGIVPRHYYQVPGGEFWVYADYPAAHFKYSSKHTLTLTLKGSDMLTCRLIIINKGKELPKDLTLQTRQGRTRHTLPSKRLSSGDLEFEVAGNQQILISW